MSLGWAIITTEQTRFCRNVRVQQWLGNSQHIVTHSHSVVDVRRLDGCQAYAGFALGARPGNFTFAFFLPTGEAPERQASLRAAGLQDERCLAEAAIVDADNVH